MRAHHQLGNIGASAEKQHLKLLEMRTSSLMLSRRDAREDAQLSTCSREEKASAALPVASSETVPTL